MAKTTTKKTAPKKTAELAVLVTTAHRGVFFGYLDPARVNDEVLVLARARLCTFWSRAMKGFLGLATMGPDDACRIGTAGKLVRLRGITSVTECSAEAVARWEAQPWGA